jgi:hypothetical protein
VQGKEPDVELMLSDDEVGNVVQDLVSSSSRKVTIDDCDSAVFMGLSHTTPSVDLPARPSQRPSILQNHRRRDERLWIYNEVGHGNRGSRMVMLELWPHKHTHRNTPARG